MFFIVSFIFNGATSFIQKIGLFKIYSHAKAVPNLRLPISPYSKIVHHIYYSTYLTYNVEAILVQNSNSAHKISLHISDNYDQHSVSNVTTFDSDITNSVHYNAGSFLEWYFGIESFFAKSLVTPSRKPTSFTSLVFVCPRAWMMRY